MKQLCAFFFFFFLFPVLPGADGTQVDWKTKGYDSGLVSAQRGAPLCNALQTDPGCLALESVPFIILGKTMHWQLETMQHTVCHLFLTLVCSRMLECTQA